MSDVPKQGGKVRAVRAYSKPATLLNLDQRTVEARMMRETRAALLAHCGGRPSATQNILIDRAVRLSLQIALMDAKQADGGLTERDGRQYLAWVNTLTRLMRQLGVKPAADRQPSLAEHIASRTRAAA